MGLDPGPRANVSFTTFVYSLPGADNPGVGPHGHAQRVRRLDPFAVLGHLGVGFQDERPHAGQGLPAPSLQVGIRWSMSRDAGFPVSCLPSAS